MTRCVDIAGPRVWRIKACLEWLRDTADTAALDKALPPTLFVFKSLSEQRPHVFVNWEITFYESTNFTETYGVQSRKMATEVSVILRFYNLDDLRLSLPDTSKDDEVTFQWTVVRDVPLALLHTVTVEDTGRVYEWKYAASRAFNILAATRCDLSFIQQQVSGALVKSIPATDRGTAVTLPVLCMYVLACCLELGIGSGVARKICAYLKQLTAVFDVDVVKDDTLKWNLVVRDTTRSGFIPSGYSRTFLLPSLSRGKDEQLDSFNKKPHE